MNDKLPSDLLDSPERKVLNLPQAAEFLSISKSYLYKLTSTNKIPYYKPRGKLIYFLQSELIDWMLQGRNQTTEEALDLASDYCRQQKNPME